MAVPIAKLKPTSPSDPYTKTLSRSLLVLLIGFGVAQIAWSTWIWYRLSFLEATHPEHLSHLTYTISLGTFLFIAAMGSVALISFGYWRKHWATYLRNLAENSEAYRNREAFLEEIQSLAQVGSWEYNAVSHQLLWNELTYQIMGMDASVPITPDRMLTLLHPEDREATKKTVENAFRNLKPFDHYYRVCIPSGQVRYIHEIGRPYTDETGKFLGAYGAVQDITLLREAEELLRTTNEELEKRVAERTTELSIANETLQERETFLRLLLEHIPLYLYWKDKNSVYLGCNTNYAKAHYKETPEEIIGKTDYDLVPNKQRTEIYHGLDQQVVQTNQPILHELQKIDSPTAAVKWIDSSKIPMHNAQGDIIGILGYFEDVTEQMTALQALVQREEVLRTVIHNAPVILFSVDKNEMFTFVDGAVLEGIHRTSAELLGTSITQFVTSDDPFIHSVRRALGGEHHDVLLESEETRFETHFAPMRDENGEIQGIIGVAVDLTERLAVEQIAKEQQALLTNVLNTAPNIIYVKDGEGRFTLANQATADLFGVTVEEMLGKQESDFTLLTEDETPLFSHSTGYHQEQFLPEKRIVTPNGAVRWIQIIKRPLYSAKGEATHILGIVTDITQRKKVEEDLIRAKEAAEVANRAKSQLIASMSHELRTPLNAVLGFAEMLAEESVGELNAKQKRFSENIITSGKQLLRLINDVLELAKLDANRLEMEFMAFAPKQAINDVLQLTAHASGVKKVVIHTVISDNLTEITADQARFKQILYTLIDNAIKFSPEGATVSVTAEIKETNTSDDNLLITVSDEGSGIHPDDLTRIFYETEPLGASERHKYTGIRIGLALIRRLVVAHGGHIWAKNREDTNGSRFCFELPLQANYSLLSHSQSQVIEGIH